METFSNYWLIWLIYLAAAAVFYTIFWKITDFKRARWLSYALRAVIIAIILTPWYASPEGQVLAPALIIVMLDAITIGATSAARAMVPLALSVTIALIIAAIMLLINNRKKS